MTVSEETLWLCWGAIGLASHLFWYWRMGAFDMGLGWLLFLSSMPAAVVFGPLTFLADGIFVYLATGDLGDQ